MKPSPLQRKDLAAIMLGRVCLCPKAGMSNLWLVGQNWPAKATNLTHSKALQSCEMFQFGSFHCILHPEACKSLRTHHVSKVVFGTVILIQTRVLNPF